MADVGEAAALDAVQCHPNDVGAAPPDDRADCLEEGDPVVLENLGDRTLPPLPEPLHSQKRSEASMGTLLVVGITAILAAATFGAVLLNPEFPGPARWVFPFLICCEAVVAAICLVGLLCGDPGVVRRSPGTCSPVPREVAACLDAGEVLNVASNIVVDEQTYCVRCLVWRPKGSPVHHCRICQRCVADFDHHCSVFGRCIAGRMPLRELLRARVPQCPGNLKYFVGLISAGLAGGATGLCAAAVSVTYISDAHTQRSVAICLSVVLAWLWCCCRGPLRYLCRLCRPSCPASASRVEAASAS